MLSENPSEIAQLHHIGTLQTGKRADVLLLNEFLGLQNVYIRGKKLA